MKKFFTINCFFLLLFANSSLAQIQSLTINTNTDASLGFHTNFATANTNFGNAQQFSAYCIPGASVGVNINRGIIRYSLNSFTSLPNFNEVIFQSAGFNLFARPNTGFLVGHFGQANSSKIYRVTQDWAENTVTWNNQPATTSDGAVLVPQNTVQFQDYPNLNISNFVDYWLNNPSQNFGMILRLDNEVINNGLNFFSSDAPETSKHPTLFVNYVRLSITNLPTFICLPSQPVALNANYQGGIFAGPGVQNGIFNPNLAGNGIHIITYSVTLPNGTIKSTSKSINVISPPQLSISGPSFVCPNATVNLQVQTNSPFTWENGSTANPRSVSAGTFTATAVSEAGCSTQVQKVVNPTIVQPIVIQADGATSFCQGGSVILSVNGLQNFTWNDGGNQNPRTVSSSGNFFVNASGDCPQISNVVQVTVNPNPATPSISPAGPVININFGSSVLLTSSAANGNLWNPSNQTSQSISVNQAGSYSVKVTNDNNCFSVSSPIQVNINPLPPITGECYAFNVIDALTQQGLDKNNNSVADIRSNSAQALGQPDPIINGTVNFYSLGFGGFITLMFEQPIANGPGADVKIYEATWNNGDCNAYPERAEIFASQDGCNFIYLTTICRTDVVDLTDQFDWALYIQIRDVSNPNQFSDAADGYDVAGIECLNGLANNLTPSSLIAGTLQSIPIYNPGPRKNGTQVLNNRKITNNAKGFPGGAGINFVSLGFGGVLEGKFDYVVFNKLGLDLNVVETSFGNPICNNYPETARIFGSKNGADWSYLGSRCLDGLYDLGSLPWLQYVRVIDSSFVGSSKFNAVADGFDLDGIVDLNACFANARLQSLDNVTTPNDNFEVVTFPNPVNDFITIEAKDLNTSTVLVELLDAAGRKVIIEQVSVNNGLLSRTFYLNDIPKGVYFLNVSSSDGIFTQKVIK